MIDKASLQTLSGSRAILNCAEDFAYLLPCEALRGLLSNFTLSFPDPSTISDAYTVLPHGSVTLVFFVHHRELHRFLFGPTTKIHKVGNLANRCEVIFILEFEPAGFFPFTKINQKELTDKIIPFSWIDHSLDQALCRIFEAASTVEELLNAFEHELLDRVQSHCPQELTQAIKIIIEREGVLTSAELSKYSFYSPRHLNRLFDSTLGMSPKIFSRLVRINKAIRLLNERNTSLAVVCEKLGYYDVSHFVKDFKLVCGITPQEYKDRMSDFYSEIAKF